MTRGFVAVKLPDAVLDAVDGLVAGLDVPGARMTTRDQHHLTLQFLGNHADLDAVAAALKGVGASGGRVRLGGGGAFPKPRRAAVLWIGLAEGADVVDRLARAVAERTTILGHEPDERAFHPHVTLARTKTPRDLRVAVAAIGDEPLGPA